MAFTPMFYHDIIAQNNEQDFCDSLTLALTQLWRHKSPEGKSMWEPLHKSKYGIMYQTAEGPVLQFGYALQWLPVQEQIAWKEMCNLITKWEAVDLETRTLIQRTSAQVDQVRYCNFELSTGKWIIQNTVLTIAEKLSKSYIDARKDKRIRKPDIVLNEENYNNHFIWDDQWRSKLENITLIMARPNDIALYLSLADKNLTMAKKIFEKEYNARHNQFYGLLLRMEETTAFYDYFEYIIAAIIFSYTAIEALANTCIVEGYEHITDIDGVKTIYSKQGIERKFPLREKLKKMVKGILKTPDPSKEKWWQLFLDLEEIRNEIIHTKQGKSEDRYSLFMSRRIFKLVEVSRTIVDYYGRFINANCSELLIDFPYGHDADNAAPYFMSNEAYWRQLREMHNISDNKKPGD